MGELSNSNNSDNTNTNTNNISSNNNNHNDDESLSSERAPLLLPANYHPDCPGCRVQLRKSSSKAPPRKELCFIAFLVLCNALPIASLFPFIYFMVRDFGIASSETKIGSYAGYIGSGMMLGRFLTSAPWGMVADKYGRKPVMLIGTASIVIFNTLFGFSSNFWMALASRMLLGMFNGILGTVRAYACEICSKEHQALGLSLVSTMWGVGLIIGPAIGGYLAQPADKYPSLFPDGSLFSTFPYALPCICISAFAFAGLILSFWIPETLHNHPKEVVVITIDTNCDSKTEDVECGQSPIRSSVISKSDNPVKTKPLWKNWGTTASIFVYCLWGLHAMAYSEVFSLWAVSPEKYGGLDFTTSDVGDVLSVAGASLLLFQLLIFPRVAKYFGAITVVRLPAVLTVAITALYPAIAYLRGITLWGVLMSAAALKSILGSCVVTGTFMLINNSVVSTQRGLANGVSTSLMSLFKAVAPASAGAIFSWAQGRMDASFLPGMWMVFSILSLLALITVIITVEPILPRSLNNAVSED